MNKSAKVSLLLLWLAGIISNISGWIFVVLANKHLTLIEMGNLGLYTNIITLASIGSVAIGITTNRFQAVYIQNKKTLLYGYTASLGKVAAMCGMAFGLLYMLSSPWWVIRFNFPHSWHLIIITGSVFIIMFPLAWLRSVLQAHALFSLVGFGLLIEGIAKIGIGLASAGIDKPFLGFMSAMTLSSLVAYILILIPQKTLVKKVITNRIKLKHAHWLFLSQTLMQRVGVISLLTLDIIFAKYFLEPEQAGIYALLSLSGKVIYFLTQSVYVLVTPLISPYLHETKKRHMLFTGIIVASMMLFSGIIMLYSIYPQYSLGLMLGERYQLIQPFVFKYSLASGLLSLALIATLYKLLRKQYITSGLVIVGLITEIVLMCAHHQTLGDIVDNVLWSSTLMVIVLVVAFGYQAFADKFQHTLKDTIR